MTQLLICLLTLLFSLSGPAMEGNADFWHSTLAAKSAATVDQYALKAVEDGFYPVMKRGFSEPQGGVWLNAGDVWKYGTTKNPATRYPKSFLGEWGLRYSPQNSGTLQEVLAAEKANILRYEAEHGVLPPGNKIRR